MKINRAFDEGRYIKKITGKEFQASGMLWFVNSILHNFGMALSYDPETDVIEPVITRFRGFDEASNDKGYRALTEYMRDNAENLMVDVTD